MLSCFPLEIERIANGKCAFSKFEIPLPQFKKMSVVVSTQNEKSDSSFANM